MHSIEQAQPLSGLNYHSQPHEHMHSMKNPSSYSSGMAKEGEAYDQAVQHLQHVVKEMYGPAQASKSC